MNMINISEKKWFPNVVAILIGVVSYVALTHIDSIGKFVMALFDVVYPLFAGAIIAYLINPLMRFFDTKIYKKIKKEKPRKILSLVSAIAIVVLFMAFLIDTLIPQIYESVVAFAGNINLYMDKLDALMKTAGLSGISNLALIKGLTSSSKDFFGSVARYVSEHGDEIGDYASLIGGHIAAWGIGMILAIYFLADKDKIKVFAKSAVVRFKKENADDYISYFRKCDEIMSKYIVYSIIEAVIVGSVNATFMWICGMQYIGLVSVAVGVTNLIPVFGPVIGAAIGGFVLLLVNPLHALIFLIFTIVLQTVDGYILKPRMFGETFGVSGLWILIAIVIGGRIAGMVGILLSIPAAAIIDLSIKTWREYWSKEIDINEQVNRF